jgi:extracellular elastinolytic metalloproteinase
VRKKRTRVIAVASATALLGLALNGTAGAQVHAKPAPAQHTAGSRDFRGGQRTPSAKQRALATQQKISATFNKLGTTSSVAAAGKPLATGLPAEPVAAARAYLTQQRELLGVSQKAIDSLEVVATNPIGNGTAVLMRERFGNLPAGHDGLVAVGVAGGNAYIVTSSLAPDVSTPDAATMPAQDAVKHAAENVGLKAGSVAVKGSDPGGWSRLSASGLQGTQGAKLVAVPMPNGGARAAYEVSVSDSTASGTQSYTSYVDARTGDVLVRDDNVDDDTDNPEYKAFPENPPADYSSRDNRETWCQQATAGCDRVIADTASPLAWDVDPTVSGTASTQTTRGNNEYAADATQNATGTGFNFNGFATPRPDREYTYPWTNQWQTTKCNPAAFDSPQRVDLDAAAANLLAMHNRMHNFSYHLGFTESAFNLQADNFGNGGLANDPEHGNVQSGARVTTALIRDNANQATPPDGQAPTTNMFLWQSIAGSFYAPCVDGDYDMSVIGHEYTHAISNRMVAGPDGRLTGFQAGAMGESWSDLDAMEYLDSNNLIPRGQSPFVTGQYVTGNKTAGIRDYALNKNPLNYSDLGFDTPGPEVHADGEIWNGTQVELRQAFIDRYGLGSSSLRESCDAGKTPVSKCPGSRRWIQLVYDAWLLMANGNVSMLDARDAMLAADQMRFGGADQTLMWNVFAHRGMGQGASSNTNNDDQAVPSFASPKAANGTVRFQAVDEHGQAVPNTQFFVGDYQDRAVPIADADASTPLTDSAMFTPGDYRLVFRAPGHGMKRLTMHVSAGSSRTLRATLPTNLASAASGATATGDGVDQPFLIDDDEATTWGVLGAAAQPVAGKQVTVKLAGQGPQHVRRVQVSAMLRGASPTDPGGDTQGENRFTALRAFKVLACTASATVDCSQAADYRTVFTSAKDAFPTQIPRPVAPNLIMRSFSIPGTTATHLRFQVVSSQCTGNPAYAGQQTNDPNVPTDCTTGSPISGQVHAAEFQAFTQ